MKLFFEAHRHIHNNILSIVFQIKQHILSHTQDKGLKKLRYSKKYIRHSFTQIHIDLKNCDPVKCCNTLIRNSRLTFEYVNSFVETLQETIL